ncbi:hypothetical protein CASFOL_028636 [Castilleja foliolosa]|uniref:Reverse transcriptase Ty1/copia-type domain-containing protein n=1 Tax=Castilleja foliolosa TaxID=1961234 RepID=A0ABD3CCH4_9LAMI
MDSSLIAIMEVLFDDDTENNISSTNEDQPLSSDEVEVLSHHIGTPFRRTVQDEVEVSSHHSEIPSTNNIEVGPQIEQVDRAKESASSTSKRQIQKSPPPGIILRRMIQQSKYSPEKISKGSRMEDGYDGGNESSRKECNLGEMQSPSWKEVVGFFSIKYNIDRTIERYKILLVAKGYTQVYGVDNSETFSSVAKIDTIRVQFSVTANQDSVLYQFDVENVFFHGNIEEEVYIEAPPGFDGNKVK